MVGSAEAERILDRFRDGDVLVQLPAKHSKRMIVLAWLAEGFEAGAEYPEAEVNARLERHGVDRATLRRLLVDHGFLTRDHGVYRRVPPEH